MSCPGYVHTNGYLAPLRTACRRQEPQRDGEAARTFTVRAHTSPRSGPRVVEQALPWAWNQWRAIRFDEHGHGCLRGISVLCQVPILNVRLKASSSSHSFTPRGALAVVQARTQVALRLVSAPIQREVLIATCAIVGFAELKEQAMAGVHEFLFLRRPTHIVHLYIHYINTICKHMVLPEKLLDYFLRSKKNNIHQSYTDRRHHLYIYIYIWNIYYDDCCYYFQE